MSETINLKPMPLWQSILLFAIPSTHFVGITYGVIPYFKDKLNLHPALCWLFSGYLVFVPLFVLTLILYKMEGHNFKIHTILERFRIKRLSKNDWKWFAFSMVAIPALTGLIMLISRILFERFGIRELQNTPPFMQFEALKENQLYYLLIWLPVFFFNIIGEEILWRGYILPRQELRHGKYAWMINSLLWLVFHLCFGMALIIILLPILIIVPFVAYKTKNTTIGILTHALLNGPMFILISLGIV